VTLQQAAAALASYLARQAELDHRQLDTLRFGLEIIMGALVAQGADLTPTGYRLIARYDRWL